MLSCKRTLGLPSILSTSLAPEYLVPNAPVPPVQHRSPVQRAVFFQSQFHTNTQKLFKFFELLFRGLKPFYFFILKWDQIQRIAIYFTAVASDLHLCNSNSRAESKLCKRDLKTNGRDENVTRHTRTHRKTHTHIHSVSGAPALPGPSSKLSLALTNPTNTLVCHGYYFKRCFRVTLKFAHTIKPNLHLQSVKWCGDAGAFASYNPPYICTPFFREQIRSPFSTDNTRPLLPTSIPKTRGQARLKELLRQQQSG